MAKLGSKLRMFLFTQIKDGFLFSLSVSGIIVHIILAFVFVSLGRWEFTLLNIFSILIYVVGMVLNIKNLINKALLSIAYIDMMVNVFLCNICFGLETAFYIYVFVAIPIIFYGYSRGRKHKRKGFNAIVLSLISVMAVLASLSVIPFAPIASKADELSVFQINILLGTVLIVCTTFEYLVEAKKNVDNLSHIAERDPLTGLGNRYSINKLTNDIHGTQYCVIVSDVDNFKKINDTYGYDIGDKVLSRIANVLQSSVRQGDVVCRWGGEEFLMVIRSNLSETMAIVEKIRSRLLDKAIILNNNEIYVSMTFGIADCLEEGSLENVISIADQNLLRGKANGKNCVITSNDNIKPTLANDGESELDTSFLNSPIFSALAETSDVTYIFTCNLNTNVSRWSKTAVEYFGLPGEYMLDVDTTWIGFVHPDDRELYTNSIKDVIMGKKRYHNITYRARNKDGEYVICKCNGLVTENEADIPPMFVGTITNLGLAGDDFIAEENL